MEGKERKGMLTGVKRKLLIDELPLNSWYLSGLSEVHLHGTNPKNAGFGLFSQNVFLKGAIVAESGSIAGIGMRSSSLFTGPGIYGNKNTGFYLDSEGSMSLKDNLTFDGDTLFISGTVSASVGNIGGWTVGKNKLSTAGFEIANISQTYALSSSKFNVKSIPYKPRNLGF